MTLSNVLEEICAEEYALPENAPAHRFKRSHRRAMNAVLYPDGLPKTERKLKLKRRLLVAAAVVVLAVVTGAAASFYHNNGFAFYKGKIGDIKYYTMLVENRENAPKTIEKMIYDDNVPEDFILDGIYTAEGTVDEGRFVSTQYISRSPERINKFGKQGALLIIEQHTKSFFVAPITDETVTPIEVKGGCKGFTILSEDNLNGVVWDSGDYIHTVFSSLSIEDTLVIVENMTEK